MKTTEDMVIQGDCLQVMKDIPDGSIDMVLTSPPYDNLRTYNGSLEWGEHIWKPIIQELYRVVKDGGVVVWVVGDATIKGSETGTSFKQSLWAIDCGFNLHDTMIWNKPNFSNPSSNRYHQIFEYMFVFSKGNPKFNPIKDKKNKYLTCVGKNTMRKVSGELVEIKKGVGNEFGMRTNVWNINTVGQEMMCKRPPHPAMFPEKLAQDHIISWSNEGDIVLDPFAGSGTTGKIAKLLNRHYILIEKEPEYIKIIQERLNSIPPKLL